MKGYSKPIKSFLAYFNVCIYDYKHDISDSVDSIITRLRLLGLQDHAERLIFLTKRVEEQQGTIIFIDGLKSFLLLLTLLFFIESNKRTIGYYYKRLKHHLKSIYSYTKQLFKPKT